MTFNYYDTKPVVALIGSIRRGKRAVFTTFGIKDCEEDINDYKYTGYSSKFEVIGVDIQELLKQMEPEYILKASEEELADLMQIFGASDNIDAWRDLRILQINAYGSSDSVNLFYINNQKHWYDKSTRVGLVNMYQLSSQWGEGEVPPLWVGTNKIQVSSTDAALNMLAKIEQYASLCNSITQQHLAAVENAYSSKDVELLRTCDVTGGYPEPVVIEL